MTPKDRSEISQEITKILEKHKNMSPFQLANIIVKEVVVPYVEIEKAAYERLMFVRRDTRRPH